MSCLFDPCSMITIDVHTPRSELVKELEDDDSSDEEEMFDMVSVKK